MRTGDVEPVARLVEGALDAWVSRTCEQCGQGYATRTEVESRVCHACADSTARRERLIEEAQRVVDNLDAWVQKSLAASGLTPRERTANLGQLAPNVRRVLNDPRLHVRTMLDGVTPQTGFGLIGPTGTGKTFALAAILANMTAKRWLARCDAEGLAATKRFVAWVRWPEEVNRFRTLVSSRDGGLEEAQRVVDRWAETEVLVLDDLGAERLRGDYSEDWATSLLDLLVDRRHNDMLPVWWTSNLTREEFITRYGTRLWSRLAGDNPAAVVPNGPDLRVFQKGGNE